LASLLSLLTEMVYKAIHTLFSFDFNFVENYIRMRIDFYLANI
jgi:hypothetical protein